MRILDNVFDLIVEEVKNKNLFFKLMSEWKKTFPNLTDEQGEYIYNRHDQLKGQIKPNNPAVISFLSRYDGQFGTKKYELKDLTDITRFNIKELLEFLKEFSKIDLNIDDEAVDDSKQKEEEYKKIFSQNANQKTPLKIEASKQMWMDQSTAKINEGDFRVYEILNQEQSIRMGYYYQSIHLKNYIEKDGRGINNPWCVTWRGNDVKEYKTDEQGNPIGAPLFSHSGNMYRNYRVNESRTFYFVIDESRPEDDKYHMSALQIQNNGTYRLTSMFNDGDNIMSWEDIVGIYPKIAEHRDAIQPRKMDEDEITTLSIIDRINENPTSPNEFARQTPQIKEQYIDALGTLKEPKSWNSMGKELRVKYVDLMQVNDAFQRFSNFEFLRTVLSTEGFSARLERKLKILGIQEGVSYLVNNVMKSFVKGRVSLDNPNIRLLYNKDRQKFGLHNSSTLDWVNFNGVEYEAFYSIIDTQMWLDEEGNQYIVETYSKSNAVDNTTFYCVYPVEFEKEYPDGHFLSQNAFLELSKNLTPAEDEESPSMISSLDKEKVDIKEFKKGQ